jgi:hypothetical protein
MIHGATVFSVADLNGSNGHLYGKYKMNGQIIDIECLEEFENEGVTYVRIKQSNTYDHVKTSKIYNLFHSNETLW